MSDEKKSTGRHYVRLAGASAGVLAAGAVAKLFAERTIVAHRASRAEVPFGSLEGDQHPVVTDDGVELHVEVDEGAADGLTVVFVHGFCLSLDSWHFQRIAMREAGVRAVFYDHRAHGRSGQAAPGSSTIDRLGEDLGQVIDSVAGDGPVLVVAHSMGGMSVMALAEQHPEWFSSRIVGVALLNTSSGGLQTGSLGLPGVPGKVVHRLAPGVVSGLNRTPKLVQAGRRLGSDVMFVATRRLAFGGPVPPEYVDFLDDLLNRTPFEVVAQFFAEFDLVDKRHALAVLGAIPTLIVGGAADKFTPVEHSRLMAAEIGRSQLVELEGTGHVAMIERHDEVSELLVRLVGQVVDAGRP